MNHSIQQRSLSEIGKILIDQKKEMGYAHNSISICENDLKHLKTFMEQEGVELYSTDIDERYLATEYCNKTNIRHSMCRTFISQLDDCMLYGKYVLYHCNKETASTPDCFIEIEAKYADWCREKGNGTVTLQHKHHAFACFFSFLESIGCIDISDMRPDHIIKAVSNEKSPDNHRYFREILKFLAEMDLVLYDYSALIPKSRSSFHLPSTYDKEERKLLESVSDRSKALGKRDYAIILLANRLGIRSGDIAGMTFNDVLFDQDKIVFSQEKTKDAQELYLVKDVKDALLDYIENGRPDSDNKYIFLSCHAPHNPLHHSAIYCIILVMLESRLTEYLPDQEGKRTNTIKSYRDSWRVLVQFLYEIKGTPADQVDFKTLDYDTLLEFFDWLKDERKCSASTRNSRLAAITKFSEYLKGFRR